MVEKDGASAAPPIGGQQDDLYMADPQLMLGQQASIAGSANVEEENGRCLYVGAPWEDDVITDRSDVDDFKEVSWTIVRTLAVRTSTIILQLQNIL
jgi:hypothetical protein